MLRQSSRVNNSPQKKYKNTFSESVLAYCRISSIQQTVRRESLTEQIQRLKEFALRKDMSIAGFYQDTGCTARKEFLPEFRRMMERAKQDPEISAILVTDLSRLTRCPYRYHQVTDKLMTTGVLLVSIGETAGFDRRV